MLQLTKINKIYLTCNSHFRPNHLRSGSSYTFRTMYAMTMLPMNTVTAHGHASEKGTPVKVQE